MSEKQNTTEEHPLTLYNSLTRTKERFIPQNPKRVTMYNCGPTVYSYAHIGNARAAVVADVLFRVLRHIYGDNHVEYARNITDVDDKIIAAAKEQNVPISEITEKYAKIYNDDLTAIGCLAPTHQPKASEAIEEMQDIIIELLEKGIAYVADNQVLFDVTKMDEYGKLSGRKLEDNLAGARVDVVGYKRNPSDFLLWKHVTDGQGADHVIPAIKLEKFANENWRKFSNSPKSLSPGRPGWHIECSAMIRQVLGKTIDIHCGGVDLKFPHHENEIAQSECANEEPLANFWVHNEFLNMGSEKMSKSLGNVTLIHDLLKDWDGEVIRLALLKAHYRSELSWSNELLRESKAQLDGWYAKIAKNSKKDEFDKRVSETIWVDVTNDLDTPEWIANCHRLVSNITILGQQISRNYSQSISRGDDEFAKFADSQNVLIREEISATLNSANLLGLLQKDPEEWFRGNTSDDEEDEINDLIQQRDAAKTAAIAAKKTGDKVLMGEQFKRSDEIRDKLKARGIVLEDGPDGTTWRRE